MKSFLLSATFFIFSFYSHSQALITIGKNTVSKDEFLKAYNKNKTAVTDKEKSIREYVTLYTNFKLKVQAAKELRLDTLPTLINDVATFRTQTEENYMVDSSVVRSMLDEAFQRNQQDLHVVHYSIAISPDASPEDTAEKYKAIQELYKSLSSASSVANFESTSQIKVSDFGYVTVFTLPYQYENIIYGLKVGQVSKPYRSKKAWHVFKVVDQRKSIGKWKIAQILLSFPPNAKDETKRIATRLADSLYNVLQNGADFAKIATAYSEDKLTYLNGGELPEFSTGKYDYNFEKEAVALSKDGDVSHPFITAFGVHIIKRLGWTPTPIKKDDETFQFELKQKLLQSDRVKIAKEKFAKDIASKIGFKINTVVKQEDILRFSDTVMTNPASELTSQLPISDKIIISFSKGSVKGKDWLEYVREYKTNTELYKEETNAQLWDKYKMVASMDYYRKHLDEYSKEFSYQLQEFSEGNMLFEIMDREVWSKAGKDSVGLSNYYSANKSKYKWDASADAVIINCSEELLAKDAKDSLLSGIYWKNLALNDPAHYQADSGRFELAQLHESQKAIDGYVSGITVNSDGTASFVQYLHLYEPNQQRSFEDAKGMLINDYQVVLENKWIELLRKKYPVKINEPLLKSIITHND